MKYTKVKFKNISMEVPLCEDIEDLLEVFPIDVRNFLGEELDLPTFLTMFNLVDFEDLDAKSDVKTKIIDYCDDDICFSIQRIPTNAIDFGEKGMFKSNIVERAYVEDGEEIFALDCMYDG